MEQGNLLRKNFLAMSAGACGILVPQPGTEPVPMVRMGLNHWTTRNFPEKEI